MFCKSVRFLKFKTRRQLFSKLQKCKLSEDPIVLLINLLFLLLYIFLFIFILIGALFSKIVLWSCITLLYLWFYNKKKKINLWQ